MKYTKSRLPVISSPVFFDELFRHDILDANHNARVAQVCPKCQGSGKYYRQADEHTKILEACDECDGVGGLDTPVDLFDPKIECQESRERENGWVLCPGCGRDFKLKDSARWSGLRHSCGQLIKIQQ